MSDTSLHHTLTSFLRGLSQDDLGALLTARRDVVSPPPAGFSTLARRLCAPSSLRYAASLLSATEQLVWEALAARGGEITPVTKRQVQAIITSRLPADQRPSAAERSAALARLEQLGLAIPEGKGWRCSNAQAHMPLSRTLLPPEGALLRAEEVIATVEHLPAGCRKVVDALARGSGVGVTKQAGKDADPDSPISQLLAAGVLERTSPTTVQLVPAAARAWTTPPTPDPCILAPAATPGAPASDVDARAAGQAAETTRLVVLLLQSLSEHPQPVLKQATIGVRAAASLMEALDSDLTTTARILYLARAAHLIAVGVPDPLPHDAGDNDFLAPTLAADDFLHASMADQWAQLVGAWLESSSCSWLVDTPGSGAKPLRIFDPETTVPGVAERKRVLMGLAVELPADHGYAAFDAVAALQHTRPALFSSPTDIAHARGILNEWEALGLGWRGQPSTVARLGAGASAAQRAEAIARHLPAPCTTLIPQGDMTVLAPGPLTPAVAGPLSTFAEVESPGLATVWRVSDASIKRGLSAGMSQADILGHLRAHIVGELPQAMEYLINDVARTHGVLRGGAAVSYLRCDDEALLKEVVTSPAGSSAGLSLIAPTVAIAQVPLVQVLANLQAAGYQPVAEDRHGGRISMQAAPARIAVRTTPTPPSQHSGVADALAALAKNSEHEGVVIGGREPISGDDVMSILSAAVTNRRQVRLNFVAKDGQAHHSVVQPVSVRQGTMDGLTSTGTVMRVALHLITSVDWLD